MPRWKNLKELEGKEVTVNWEQSAAKPKKGSKREQPTEAQRAVRAAKRGALERAFLDHWVRVGGPRDFWKKDWIEGYEGFESKYELDFYNDQYRVAVEVQGGQYMDNSGHKNIKGLARDARKIAKCIALKITLYHIPNDLCNDRWAEEILQFVRRKQSELE